MTNEKRLHVLNKTMDSLMRYSGPVAAMETGEDGVDNDLWEQLMAFKAALEARIDEVKELDWEKEAV